MSGVHGYEQSFNHVAERMSVGFVRRGHVIATMNKTNGHTLNRVAGERLRVRYREKKALPYLFSRQTGIWNPSVKTLDSGTELARPLISNE